jgi:hypothetical protein
MKQDERRNPALICLARGPAWTSSSRPKASDEPTANRSSCRVLTGRTSPTGASLVGEPVRRVLSSSSLGQVKYTKP